MPTTQSYKFPLARWTKAKKKLSEGLTKPKSWFDSYELIINLRKGKTESIIFGTSKRRNKLNSKVMEIELNGIKINGTSNYKYLRIHLDQSLAFENHSSKTYKQAISRLSLLRKIRGFVDSSTAELIYRIMLMPIFGYCELIFLGCSQPYKKRINYIECKAKSVMTSHNANIDQHIPTIDSMIKKRACALVFHSLQSNACDVMKGYFTKTVHGKNARNNEISVKLPQTRTEFGRKGVHFSAAKKYNSLPLQARKTESRFLSENFLITFLIIFSFLIYSASSYIF